MNFIPILKGLQSAAHDYGVEALASEMGVSAANLYAMLNPYAVDKKNLWLERALLIMSRSGNFSALGEYLDQHGYRIVSKHSQPDGQDMNHECLQAALASSAFLRRASQDAHYTELLPLLEVAVKEHDDVYQRRKAENEKGINQ